MPLETEATEREMMSGMKYLDLIMIKKLGHGKRFCHIFVKWKQMLILKMNIIVKRDL